MEAMNASNVASALEPRTDEYGHIKNNDDRVTIKAEYETRNGNTRSREGQLWEVSDGGSWDDLVIRFSENAGETDEDPYFVRVRGDEVKLFSISLASDTETELGEVENLEVEGLDTDDDTDDMDEAVDDVMSVFDEPDEISEGMELTEDGETVYLIKSIRGNDATVSIWKDGRRKRKQSMDADDLQSDYDSGTLTVA